MSKPPKNRIDLVYMLNDKLSLLFVDRKKQKLSKKKKQKYYDLLIKDINNTN